MTMSDDDTLCEEYHGMPDDQAPTPARKVCIDCGSDQRLESCWSALDSPNDWPCQMVSRVLLERRITNAVREERERVRAEMRARLDDGAGTYTTALVVLDSVIRDT